MRLSLAEVARATGGSLADATGRERVDGSVVIDSRRVRPGSLFVALPGEHVDGHDFAAAAVAAGAAGVLAARPVGVPAVVVGPSTAARAGVVAALGRLAHVVLAAADDVTVTAITGSSGKTSTKDLVAQVLPRIGPDAGAGGLVQQRPWRPPDCAAAGASRAPPRARDGHPRSRPDRAAVPDRAAARSGSC